MKAKPTIEQNAEQLLLLRQKLTSGFSLFKGQRRNRLRKLEAVQRELINEYLLTSNNEYSGLIDEQYSILSGAQLKFTTHKTRNTAASSYSYSFEGLLRSNGHGYLDVKKSSFAIGLLYSSEFEGQIDPFGRMEMKSVSVGGSVIKSFPTKFEGEVFERGYYRLATVETDWEVLTEGIALSMIGSVLTNGAKIKRFFSNKEALVRLREEHKADIEKKLITKSNRK